MKLAAETKPLREVTTRKSTPVSPPMPELISQKIAPMQESLTELERIIPATYDELFADARTIPAMERHFQLIADSAVDCNNIILERAGLDKAETYFGTFTALRDHQLLPAHLADSLAPSVGLRNAIVHRYETVDRMRMYQSMQRFIPLFKEYLSVIVKAAQ